MAKQDLSEFSSSQDRTQSPLDSQKSPLKQNLERKKTQHVESEKNKNKQHQQQPPIPQKFDRNEGEQHSQKG